MIEINDTPPKPFLKWAGGKRWLTQGDFNLFPANFNTYIEPFLGSGAVYFHLQPEHAILSDLNNELISTYKAIKENQELVLKHLKKHHSNHSKEYYYKIRSEKPRSIYTRAARMLYLNRACWNGLYRVNLKGEFNVPIGTKTNILFDIDNFKSTSSSLKNATLLSNDFEETVDLAGPDDFVFLDPPYTVKHNCNGFIKYNESLFSWKDQIRLRNSIERAVTRGAKILLLNAAHQSIVDLYDDFDQVTLSRKNSLSGDSRYRGKYEELAISCGYNL
ncbi:DNA adenine methylase [Marinobacter sp. HN1S83]|uniref:DNA adenine methylase n=1 Tax=Marinobacter sp. HN1S83 TaxID=3382301 RepID=UPI00387AA012